MAWKIEVAERAARQIKKLDPPDAARIHSFLRNRLTLLGNPRQLGSPLRGSEFRNYWRYRVANYRILCEIRDDRLLLLVIEVGHRRSVYRNR